MVLSDSWSQQRIPPRCEGSSRTSQAGTRRERRVEYSSDRSTLANIFRVHQQSNATVNTLNYKNIRSTAGSAMDWVICSRTVRWRKMRRGCASNTADTTTRGTVPSCDVTPTDPYNNNIDNNAEWDTVPASQLPFQIYRLQLAFRLCLLPLLLH